MSWLAAPFDDPQLCAAFRPAWERGAALRWLFLPEAIPARAAARLRAAARGRLARFDRPDCGRYHAAAERSLPGLRAVARELRPLAGSITGLPLGPGRARLQRFAAGDYTLRLDDRRRRPPGALVEAILDVSPAACAADVICSEGPGVHLRVPQRPGQLALVLRSSAGSRCDRYLGCETGRRSAWRVCVPFPITGG